jgi:hypothetical protein
VTDLTQRYGGPPRTRYVTLGVVIALVAAGLGWFVWAGIAYIHPQVASQLLGFTVDSPTQLTARIQVDRATEGTQATCLVQAIAVDHSIAGEVSVPVSSGPRSQTLSVAIRTEQPGTAAKLIGCTAAGQPRPR